MGVPLPDMEPVENASAEALLDSLKSIDPAERRKHASVFNYWLSIRGKRAFPPIRDLDPLEISDAGPWSLLLEMIGGGEDAVIRHLGQDIRGGLEIDKIAEAPSPSLLSCIHAKLPIVAACREAFAFEDSFQTPEGPRQCWVTLLPFSETGTWIDFVYGYVSLDGGEVAADVEESQAPETAEEPAEAAAEEPAEVDELPEAAELPEEPVAEESEPFKVELQPYDEEPRADEPEAVAEMPPEPVEAMTDPVEEVSEEYVEKGEAEEPPAPPTRAGFSAKILEGLASSFYGKVTQAAAPAEEYYEPEPDVEPEPEPEPEAQDAQDTAADEPAAEPAYQVEGTLQNKLSDVRAMAAEAREAQVRSNIALYEGLSAAYDFALDAENEPEEYLRLVEGQGLKIQLRSPMKPVVKLAFDGMCDEPTIVQLEAVLAWALKQDLPRGTLAERIQAEGGIGQILNGHA